MDISIHCPYCTKYTSVDRLRTRTGIISGGYGNHTVALSWYNKKAKESWWMGKCNSCDGVLLVLDEGQTIYPVPQPSQTNKSIPEVIRFDIEEAKRCFSVSAFNATVVMSRRALQSMCVDKGARKEKRLFEQIDDLRNNGQITENLKVWATEIRYGGNEGAHSGETVSREDAESITTLTEEFAHSLYVVPNMAVDLKKKREDRKTQS